MRYKTFQEVVAKYGLSLGLDEQAPLTDWENGLQGMLSAKKKALPGVNNPALKHKAARECAEIEEAALMAAQLNLFGRLRKCIAEDQQEKFEWELRKPEGHAAMPPEDNPLYEQYLEIKGAAKKKWPNVTFPTAKPAAPPEPPATPQPAPVVAAPVPAIPAPTPPAPAPTPAPPVPSVPVPVVVPPAPIAPPPVPVAELKKEPPAEPFKPAPPPPVAPTPIVTRIPAEPVQTRVTPPRPVPPVTPAPTPPTPPTTTTSTQTLSQPSKPEPRPTPSDQTSPAQKESAPPHGEERSSRGKLALVGVAILLLVLGALWFGRHHPASKFVVNDGGTPQTVVEKLDLTKAGPVPGKEQAGTAARGGGDTHSTGAGSGTLASGHGDGTPVAGGGQPGGGQPGGGRGSSSAEPVRTSSRTGSATEERVSGGSQPTQLALTQRPATLQVESAPGGGIITIDGERQARTTPAEFVLSPGSYTIGLALPGFQRASKQVTLNAGDNVTCVFKGLRRQQAAEPDGTLVIRSEPAGALVLTNGVSTEENTPITLEQLVPGDYRIRLELAEHLPVEQTVNLGPGEGKRVTFTLQSHHASLRITSTPPGALVLTNGVSTDETTPILMDALPAGGYRIKLLLDGYLPAEGTLTLQAGDRKSADFPLSKQVQ